MSIERSKSFKFNYDMQLFRNLRSPNTSYLNHSEDNQKHSFHKEWSNVRPSHKNYQKKKKITDFKLIQI